MGLKISSLVTSLIFPFAPSPVVILFEVGLSFKSPIIMILALGFRFNKESTIDLVSLAAAILKGLLRASPPLFDGQWLAIMCSVSV